MRLEAIRLVDVGPFKDFSVDLAELGDARLIAVVGPNGAGKSTLLECWGPGALYRTTPTRGSLVSLATSRNAHVEARVVNGQAWTIRHSMDAVSGKSEAVVLDANGKPAFDSAKVRAFDGWAAKHLPAPEVLYSTVFAPQGAAGFLGMKPGERKAVLLRILGVEHLEDIAERCRERARSQKSEVAVLEARIADERGRAGDVDALVVELDAHREALGRSRNALEQARAELAAAEEAARGAAAARQTYDAAVAERAEWTTSRDKEAAALVDLETRIANNRSVLAEADAIRAAEARLVKLDAELADVRVEAERASAEAREYSARAAIENRTLDDARARKREAETRLQRAQARLADRERVLAAVGQVDACKTGLASAEDDQRNDEEILEQVRATRLAGAEQRIHDLREGLATIALGTDDPAALADETLAADEEEVQAAEAYPERVARAEAEVKRSKAAVADARSALAETEALAARAPDLEVATQEAKEARNVIAVAEGAEAVALEAEYQACQAHNAAARRAQDALNRADELAAERQKVEPLARKAPRLAQAEARLAELEPQAEQARSRVAELDARLATPVPVLPPPAPEVAPLARAVEESERTAAEAERGVTLAQERLRAAQAGKERVAELQRELDVAHAELGDWNRLSADLGRDGLQAALIDAAGPELSEMTNDLLRSAFGTRFAVTIETTKLSADGKRQLEGCEVRVIDTERGRDAEAGTFSGGERVILGEAVSLALTMLSCRRHGIERPTLVRDESGAALDDANARAYVAMLRRAADIVGADRVLFVSHSREVQELADDVIEVGG